MSHIIFYTILIKLIVLQLNIDMHKLVSQILQKYVYKNAKKTLKLNNYKII